jgi:hypothetical protein
MAALGSLWTCDRCGRAFANRNQTHSCHPLIDLDTHFIGKEPLVREIFDRVVVEAQRLGPVAVLPEKSRIALHARMSFAAFVPRKRWLDGHVVLPVRLPSPRFRRVEVFSRQNVLHAFRLSQVSDIDDEFVSWLLRAYQVGRQEHLGRSGASEREFPIDTGPL